MLDSRSRKTQAPTPPTWSRRPRRPERRGPAPARPPDEGHVEEALRSAGRWLWRHGLTVGVVAFFLARFVLRVREVREARSRATAGGGEGWLGSPRRPQASARGDDPLARAAALRVEAARRPEDLLLCLELGRALLESGRAHEAAFVLAEAARRGPPDAQVQLELGRALAEACRWDDALASLAEAIRLDPDQAEAHELRGDVLGEKHWAGPDSLAPEAQAAYREAIRLYGLRLTAAPADATARARKGSLEVEVGEIETGLAELRRAAAERPADPEVQAALAGALAAADRHGEATRQYAVAAEAQRRLTLAHPSHAGHHDRFGDLLNEAGAEGDVEAWHEAALVDPDYPDLETKLVEQGGRTGRRFCEGARHLKAGGWSEAARAFREVLGDAPEHAPALYGLGLALAREGLSAEAERALARALDHWPDWPRCREALAAARGARADSTRRP